MIDIVDGTNVFIDANILVYHRIKVIRFTAVITDFLERVERKKLHGYTSTALVAEAVHKIMLAEAVQQHGLPDKGIVTRLKEHPELVKRLKHAQVTEEFEKMNISIEVVTTEIIKEAEGLFTQHGLLTNDSITLALMKRLGISNIVTNDDDFDDVGWVTVRTGLLRKHSGNPDEVLSKLLSRWRTVCFANRCRLNTDNVLFTKE